MRTTRASAVALALVAILTRSAAAHADETATPAPTLEAIAPTYDAGRVDAGTEIRHTYELRNHGPRPLQIAVKASCGCTTTDWDHEIAPGALGKVTAQLDTTHVRGRVEKTVTVTTNDPSQPPVTLTIVADAYRTLTVEPDDAPYFRGPAHTLQPRTLTVRMPNDAPFAITRVEDDATMRAELAPLDAEVAGGHGRYRLTLTPSPDLPVGTHRPILTLVTSVAGAERFVVRPTVVVEGPLVVTPKRLLVVPKQRSASTRVTAADGVPFHLLRATSSDPDFAVELAPVAGEPAWNVTVRYVGKPERKGPVSTMIVLTTDAPTQPALYVPLAGKL